MPVCCGSIIRLLPECIITCTGIRCPHNLHMAPIAVRHDGSDAVPPCGCVRDIQLCFHLLPSQFGLGTDFISGAESVCSDSTIMVLAGCTQTFTYTQFIRLTVIKD